MVKNANTDSKHLREHFKRSDAAQKKLGTNLAGKPLPKQRSGITPGGRHYDAVRFSKGNKETTVHSSQGPYSQVKTTTASKSKKYRVPQGEDGPAPMAIERVQVAWKRCDNRTEEEMRPPQGKTIVAPSGERTRTGKLPGGESTDDVTFTHDV